MAEETIELIPGTDTKIVLDELYYTVKGAMKKRLFSRFSRCCFRFKSVYYIPYRF